VTFEEFLAAELAGLSRYTAVLTGDRQRAHDVLADALVKAHVSWHRIGTLQFPLAYVRRIVTSVYLSDGRRWAVRMIRPTRTGELPDVALPDPADAIDEREHLSALLAALPPRQRAAIVLRYYLGYDNAAIANDLGITAGAVRTAISRGMAALRIRVADGPGETHAGAVGAVAAHDAGCDADLGTSTVGRPQSGAALGRVDSDPHSRLHQQEES
jgi:RNA polymerase sigma-70 factor (sigma-E family)